MIVRCLSLVCLATATVALATVALAKPPNVTPADVPVLGEVDPFLVETIYASDDPDAALQSVQADPRFNALIDKYDLRLFGGPMVGCVTPTSAKIWVRTSRAAKVQVVIVNSELKSAAVNTSAERDFTAVLTLDGLQPFTNYQYDVLVNGKSALTQPLPVFRTHPKRGDPAQFSVGFGGGARYWSDKERVWDAIEAQDPQAMLFLGDNIYIDEPEWRGKQRVMYYRRQLRPEFRRLTSSAATYSIWDDHDFGKNDTAGGPDVLKPAWKLPVWRVFRENWVNPAYGAPPQWPGCWYDFSIGDVDFFMTDGRCYRSFKDNTMLGPVQKAWLKERLAASQATFKVICSGTLWTEHADKNGKDSWWGVPEEREELFTLIDQANIPGVILLSADRHRTDIYRIKRPGGYDLYEFETSKLTNDHTHPTKKQAEFSYNKGNFFGLLKFDLAADDPTVTFECISIDSELIHRFPLKRSQLESK